MKKICKSLLAGLICITMLITACSNPFSDSKTDSESNTNNSNISDEFDNSTSDDDSNESSNDDSDDGKDDGSDSSEDNEVTEAFNSLCNDIFLELACEDALSLNYLVSDPSNFNIKDYPEKMISFNIDEYEVDLSEITGYLDRLEAIDYDALSYSQKITYDTLHYYLIGCTKFSGLELYYEPLGATLGFQAQLPITLAEYTFYTTDDIDRYLTALPSVYDTFVEIMKFEKLKSDSGLFMPDTNVDAIIKQAKSFIKDKDTNYLITSFNKKIDRFNDLSDSSKNDYKEQNREIILTKIIPAYEYMIDELNKLRGTGVNDGGLCNFDDGKNYYNYLIYSSVGDEVSVSKIKEELEATIQSNVNELLKYYLKDVNYFENLTNVKIDKMEPEDILTTLYDMSSKEFPKIEKINYTISTVDKSLEDFLSPAMYYKPPVDTRKINSIYVNNAHLSDNVSFFVTLAHEGYPGHMYQFNYEKDNDNQALRQAIGMNGISEGWAEYIEYKAYEYIDDISPEIAKGLALNTEISLCVQALADIGVNYDNWTVQDVLENTNKYFTITEDTAKKIYQSCIESPANTLSYAYGSIKYKNMEKSAQKNKGDEYDAVEFHKFLLDVGFTCFPVLENRFENDYLAD